MAQWGNTDDAANSCNWGARLFNKGSGKVAIAANNTSLYVNTTVGAIVSKQVVGQFGVSKAEKANTSGESGKVTQPGWHIRRAGMGPIKTLTAVNGTKFANGETILLSGGSTNATAVLTSNATGNLASATIVAPGGTFANASSVVVAFRREKHINDITVTGGTAYTNTDTIRVSNGTVNGTATIVTDGNGLFINSGITLTGVGLFGNTAANNTAVFTVLAANGAASNGSGATLVANLTTSATGTITAASLGGRAGRVHYECLVALKAMSNGASDNTYLPT